MSNVILVKCPVCRDVYRKPTSSEMAEHLRRNSPTAFPNFEIAPCPPRKPGISPKTLALLKENSRLNQMRIANERARTYIWNSFLFSLSISILIFALTR